MSKLNSSYLKEAFNKRKPKFQSGTEYDPVPMSEVQITAKKPKRFKSDFRSKSQMANQMGMQRDQGYVRTKTPAEQKAIKEKESEELRRRINGTIRQTTDADREWAKEYENRKNLTFAGRAGARGASSPLNDLLDAVNPFSYYYAGKDIGRGLGQTAQGIANLDPRQIGAGLTQAGLNALQVVPAVSEFKPLLGAARMVPKSVLRGASSLGKPSISRNLSDLQAAQKFAQQYGYELPQNINRIAQSNLLTDRTIRGMMDRHNTFVRGVTTNWDELQDRLINKYGKEEGTKAWNSIVKDFESKGINYINNPKAAAEYMGTHIPSRKIGERASLEDPFFEKSGYDALYTTNSVPGAEGYTYGTGYIVKGKRPTNYSSANRQDWITQNNSSYYSLNLPSFNKIKIDGIETTPLQQGFPKNISPIDYENISDYKEALLKEAKLDYEFSKKIGDLETEKKYFDVINKAKSQQWEFIPPKYDNKLLKTEFYPGRDDRFAHYIHIGKPGEQVLQPIRSWEVTPSTLKNTSRAHTGTYSKKLSAMNKGGLVSKGTYQMGGMSIPGVNGSVVSSYQATQYKKYKSKKK